MLELCLTYLSTYLPVTLATSSSSTKLSTYVPCLPTGANRLLVYILISSVSLPPYTHTLQLSLQMSVYQLLRPFVYLFLQLQAFVF